MKKSSASSWTWTFCTLGEIWVVAVEKNLPGFSSLSRFSANAEAGKKNLLAMYAHEGGASYPYPGIPTKGQEDGLKPTKSIKNTPQGTEKGVINRETVVHKYRGDRWTFPHRVH